MVCERGADGECEEVKAETKVHAGESGRLLYATADSVLTERMAKRILLGLLLLGGAGEAQAWDYAGHRIVNQTALATLPTEFPDFVREPAAAERILFLAGEPDRWRNVSEPIMKQSGGSWSDHFLDLEQLPKAGIDPVTVTSFRYDFILEFAAGRARNADKFPAIDPEKNKDHTSEWPGFAPWAITEYYARLKSAFSYLKAFEEAGTAEEIANAKANAVYAMGIMGHYVGDLAQPLHTTDHFNGWVGENPNGYTTWRGIHSWIDGGFMALTGIAFSDIAPRVKPARLIPVEPRNDGRDPVFVAVMDYLLEQHAQVEPLYRMEKAGKFSADAADRSEGRAFIEKQLLAGGQMLGALWVTAWRNAGPDVYLRAQLAKRQGGAAQEPATK